MKQLEIPGLKQVTPVDFYELIVQFDDLTYRCFSPGKSKLYDQFPFMAYPNKLRSLIFDPDRITWNNGASLHKTFIYQNSEQTAISSLKYRNMTIAFKNQAPTSEHQSHHEYRFSVRPFDTAQPFIVEASIGGGHTEMGGAIALSLNGLLDLPEWKDHLIKSGCDWAIELIAHHREDQGNLISLLTAEVCSRSVF